MQATETAEPSALPKRVRIVDLAAQLGLTKGTVSRALNDHPDISDRTRLRVRKAAEKLGYRPLSHAQAIRTGRVRSLGLVLQVNEHDAHRPFVAEFLAGLSQAASAEDWTLTVATAGSDEQTLDLLDRLTVEKKADGFILPRTKLHDPRIDFLRTRGVPFVLYGRTENAGGCAWFDIESEKSIEDAVMLLAGLDHKRIGFVPGADGYTYAKLRHDGYLAGLARSGLAHDTQLIAPPAMGRNAGAAAAAILLDLPHPPSAIVCSVDAAALGVYDAARHRGLKIGTDLSVISYDGIPETTLLDPPLSTYRVDTRAAGARLAELLIKRCRGAPPEDLRELGRAAFQSRGSHRVAPAKA